MNALCKPCRDDRGSALFIAIIAMLILGVISLSFVALGNIEMRIGMNHRESLEALNLAESAIDHARSMISAAGAPNFTNWMNTAADGSVLLSGFTGAAGTYSVRIDNDCTATIMGPNITADSSCGIHQDGNDRAILTSWATKGSGRARVRVWISASNPWKHVCYDGNNDGGGYCTGNGEYFPDDPLHPNGPASGTLPTVAPGSIQCGGDVRTPTGITLSNTDCVIQPYFNLALASNPATACTDSGCPTGGTFSGPCNFATPFTTGAMNETCGSGSGLVYWGTSTNWTHSAGGASPVDFQNMCVGDHNASTYAGLNPPHPDPTAAGSDHNDCPGATTSAHTVYVMGRVRLKNHAEINGTLVVHGDGIAGNADFDFAGQSSLHTIPGCNTVGNGTPGCGYPLALLVYDPAQAAYPQNTETHASNSNTDINGITYTAGDLNFQATDKVYGGAIGATVNFQPSSADVFYTAAYGNAAPPPGFSPVGASAPRVMRNTYSQCRYYADQATATACNE